MAPRFGAWILQVITCASFALVLPEPGATDAANPVSLRRALNGWNGPTKGVITYASTCTSSMAAAPALDTRTLTVVAVPMFVWVWLGPPSRNMLALFHWGLVPVYGRTPAVSTAPAMPKSTLRKRLMVCSLVRAGGCRLRRDS